MAIFKMYYLLGFKHIVFSGGYDHILFIAVLCAAYSYTQWKKVLILITSFTVGHSITLVLATLNLINIPTEISEFLIALTIFTTALTNIFQKNEIIPRKILIIRYTSALFFGLIHGLGFSNYLKGILGMEQSLTMPLFSFNVGVESGQFTIVLFISFIGVVLCSMFHLSGLKWNRVLSIGGLLIAVILMFNRFPWK